MIEKQLKTMKWWNLHYPSVAGQDLIATTLVVSLARYLVTGHGISLKNLLTMEEKFET